MAGENTNPGRAGGSQGERSGRALTVALLLILGLAPWCESRRLGRTLGRLWSWEIDSVSSRDCRFAGTLRSLHGGREGRLSAASASAEELALIPGVGPKLALAIVTTRRRSPFQRMDDLLSVPGIGPRTLARLTPVLCVRCAGRCPLLSKAAPKREPRSIDPTRPATKGQSATSPVPAP